MKKSLFITASAYFSVFRQITCSKMPVRKILQFVMWICLIHMLCSPLYAAETITQQKNRYERYREVFGQELTKQGIRVFSAFRQYDDGTKRTKKDKNQFYVICWAFEPFMKNGGVTFSERKQGYNVVYYVFNHEVRDVKVAKSVKNKSVMEMPDEIFPMTDFMNVPSNVPGAKQKPSVVYCLLIHKCGKLNLQAFYTDNIILPLGKKIAKLAELEKQEKNTDVLEESQEPAAAQNSIQISNQSKKASPSTPPKQPTSAAPQSQLPVQFNFNSGNPKADELLAYSVTYFQKGDPESQKKSFDFARKAAMLGSSDAQWLLGEFYLMGVGTGKDPAEAVKWFRTAAEKKNAGAQFMLGYCYAAGLGIPQDQKEALKWIKLAADQGHQKAVEIYRKMSNNQ